jgi:subtilisin family serine protease
VHLERSGAWRRWSVLAAIAVVAVAAVACLPPPPPPPPPPTTTTTQPPPSICGVTAAAAGAAATDAGAGDEHGGVDRNATEYVAVVRRNGRSKVLTRQVQSPAELAQFRADAEAEGEVTAFEADGELQALTETPTWGFVDSGFTAAWGAAPVANGTDVRVAELDTGVDTTHPDLVGRFDGTGADIVAANAVTPNLDPPPVATTDPSTSGHGTHVAGILSATEGNSLGVAGGAPGITLVPVRVLGTSGAGSYSDVAEGLYWAADVTKGNAAVITMSLGGKSTSSVVTQAIADIENPANTNYTHPVITVAAGNSGCTTPLFPSSLANTTPQMLSVSALCKVGTTSSNCSNQQPWSADLPYKLANFSSRAWSGTGSPTGIAAPGTEINSTLPGGGYGQLSGTSMATPFVAAAAALVLQHCPADTAAQAVSRLENSARDLGPAGPDTLYGFGKLDAVAAVGSC